MATFIHQQPARIEVADLDAAGVLARVSDAETQERRAGVEKLELALQWCALHPATLDTGAAVWGDSGLPGLGEWDETLGGDGTPMVAAYAPAPFAAALGVNTFTGMQVLADALDLAHRLPRTWRKTQALQVAPWKARRLAQATHQLSQRAAADVDAHLVDRIDTCGAVLIDRTCAQAAALFDPDPVELAEEEAKASWDVELHHRTDGSFAGTSHLEATGDTLDLTKLYDLVCDHAHRLAELGDCDPLGARKARALGVIADAQSHLDLFGTVPDSDHQVGRPSLAKTRMYLHLTLGDLLNLPDSLVAAGEVEKLGPVTTTRIREWLGASRATIVPVLDLERDHGVDEHDPPGWMRETVVLRDGNCVFPWCRVDAWACDLDHIEPYVAINEGGPPAQTSASKLACLCRRHHNAKTSGRWRYERNKDGTFTWHGPHGLDYLVTSLGTTPIPAA